MIQHFSAFFTIQQLRHGKKSKKPKDLSILGPIMTSLHSFFYTAKQRYLYCLIKEYRVVALSLPRWLLLIGKNSFNAT